MKRCLGQLLIILCLASCGPRKDDTPLNPPLTSPLTREYIGFGVITASFTHITEDPLEDSEPFGYLRRGSLVKIIRRQSVRTGNRFVSWVLIDAAQQGWLKEDVMDIYESESQAKTASESMSK